MDTEAKKDPVSESEPSRGPRLPEAVKKYVPLAVLGVAVLLVVALAWALYPKASQEVGALIAGLLAVFALVGGCLFVVWSLLSAGGRSGAKSSELDLTQALQTAVIPVWLGLLGLLVFSAASCSGAIGFAELLATGLGIAGASLVLGALVGFLFGVPKAPDGDSTDNTNIEEISDWLTKIIVGLGLVQLKKAPEYLSNLSGAIANTPFRQGELGVAFAILFSISGFFLGYLAARLFLPKAFARAREIQRLERENEEKQELVAELEEDVVSAQLGSGVPVGIASDREKAVLTLAAQGYVLPSAFLRESDEHKLYREMREKKWIRPRGGGSWETGKAIELRPLGKAVLDKK